MRPGLKTKQKTKNPHLSTLVFQVTSANPAFLAAANTSAGHCSPHQATPSLPPGLPLPAGENLLQETTQQCTHPRTPFLLRGGRGEDDDGWWWLLDGMRDKREPGVSYQSPMTKPSGKPSTLCPRVSPIFLSLVKNPQ